MSAAAARSPWPGRLAFALAFSVLLPLIVLMLPRHLPDRLVSPAWMPHQLVRLIELSSDLQALAIADEAATEHPRIAIVTVTESTLDGLPYVSPIDRGLLADLIRVTDRAKPAAIGLDFLLDQPTEPEKDRELAATIRSARAPVVLGVIDERIFMRAARRGWQNAFVAETGRPAGFVNLRYDTQESSGRHIIRYRSVAAPNGTVKQSFAEALGAAAGVTRTFASRRIAWLSNPRGGETFLVLDADLLQAAAKEPQGPIAALITAQLAGRIVLIGANLPERDRHFTPLTLTSQDGIPGVTVHAHILAQLLDGREVRDLPRRPLLAVLAITAFLSFLSGTMLPRNSYALPLALTAGLLLVLGLTVILLTQLRCIVPVAMIAAILLAGLVAGRFAARRLGYAFAAIRGGS